MAKLQKSKNYRVYVNGAEIQVYDTQVLFDGIDEMRMIYHPYLASFSPFDIHSEVMVEVEPLLTERIETVKIQPKRKQVNYSLEGNKICFKLQPNAKICVTVNGLSNNMLMLFANEVSNPVAKDKDILYFGKGIHKIEDNPDNRIYLKSGQTVYIDRGAVVYGRIYAKDCENISILGHGILCGSGNNGRWAQWLRPMAGITDEVPRNRLAVFEDCRNVRIEGVCLVDSDEWTASFLGCENVEVSNIKIIGYQSNSDGIDFCSSRHIRMNNSFIRTSDDCIVLKTFTDKGATQNVHVSDCILWADRASALEIGHEVCGDDICDVQYHNIDILNCLEETYGYHAIDITNADQGHVHNITYDGIYIEDCTRLIGFRTREGRFSENRNEISGSVYDITVKNVYSEVDRAIFLSGRTAESCVRNITFENIVIAGKKLGSLENMFYNPFVYNIKLSGADCILPYPCAEACTPLDIRPMCNLTVGEERGIYGISSIDWIELPSGISMMEGIPFHITGQGYGPNGYGDYKRVVVPADRLRLPFLPVLPVDMTAQWLFFLHTGVNVLSKIDETICQYVVIYEDNTKEEINVRNQNDLNDCQTWSLAGWQPVFKGLRFYIMPWKNPYRDKKIKQIQMLDGKLHDMAVLLAITIG